MTTSAFSIIFNLTKEKVVGMMNILTGREAKLIRKTVSLLAYEDGRVLLGNDTNVVECLCARLVEAVKK